MSGDEQIIDGKRVRELRNQRGWTQEELGNMILVQKSAISKIELGQRRLSSTRIRALAAVFDVSPAELLASNETFVQAEDEQEAALFRGIKNLNAEQKADVFRYVDALGKFNEVTGDNSGNQDDDKSTRGAA